MGHQRRTFLHGLLSLPAGALLAPHRSLPALDATIHNGAELQAALRAARPGSTLTLAPGDFGDVGLFDLAAAGVTLRASVPHRSVLRAPILVSGAGAKLLDLAFLDEDGGIVMAAALACVDKISIHGPDVEIAGCDFGFFPGRAILVRPDGLRTSIHDCSFHDNRNGSGDSNAHEAISLGYNNKFSDTVMKCQVVNNKLWNLNIEGEAICAKSSDNYISGNQISNSKACYSNRFGERNLFQNNVSTNAGGFAICDRGTQLIGNTVSGKGQIRILSGNQTLQSSGSGHPQATDTYLEGNSGELVIGYSYNRHKLPAVNTVVRSHNGNVQLKNHTGTQQAGRL